MSIKFTTYRSNNQNAIEKDEKDIDTIITELREKMNRIKFRLLDCQSKNQMLRKEMLLAKKVVNNEVAACTNEKFEDVLHQAISPDFRGRKEKILLLKDKLSELQNRIKELEEGNPDGLAKETRKLPKGEKCPNTKNVHNKQIMDKELQYLLENSCQMKRKLEVWKKRNTESSKEVELLRLELDRLVEKSKEDENVHISYRVVEKELRARQSEKIDMRNKLDLEKTRNEQLVEEVAMLKEEISLIVNKINDDKTLIDALNNQQGYLHDMLDRQKMIGESDNRRYRDDLREVQTKHATNINMLSHLQDIVDEKSSECQELQKMMIDTVLVEIEQEPAPSITTTIESEQSQPDDSSQSSAPGSAVQPPPNEEEPPPVEDEVISSLKEDAERYKSVYRSVHEEVEQLTRTVLTNKERISEWMSQLFQNRALYAQKSAEVGDLEDTVKRLRSFASSKKRSDSPQFCPSSIEDVMKKSDVLNEEYQSLICLWKLLMSEKEDSVKVLSLCVDCTKKLFVDAILSLTSIDTTDERPEEEQTQMESEMPA